MVVDSGAEVRIIAPCDEHHVFNKCELAVPCVLDTAGDSVSLNQVGEVICAGVRRRQRMLDPKA
eukprot:14293626-Alexandrium_andersonii.AAC.1